MKAKYHLVSREDLELFEKAVEYKEIKVPFYKKVFFLKPCGWALLVAAVFLYVVKIH